MDPNKRLLCKGLIGTAIVGLCCFTPVLVILFGAIGLSALTGYLDFILLPALALCIAVIVLALYRQRKMPDRCGRPEKTKDTTADTP